MKKQKSGISLIVLVITIIVIIILAVAVILSIANNNPIENAKEARIKNDLKTIEEELTVKQASNYVDEHTGKGTSQPIEISDLASAANYTDKLTIRDGKICIKSGSFENEEKLSEELGIDIVQEVTLKLGDEITYKNEPFYLIGGDTVGTEISDSTQNVLLLAKYNLTLDGTSQDTTGKLNSCAFASTNYWNSVEGIAYPDSTTKKYPDLNDEEKYGSGSSAIEKAKTYGSKLGAKGRLMTYDEAIILRNDYSTVLERQCTDNYSWKVWTSSACGAGEIWVIGVFANNALGDANGFVNEVYGICPILEVSKSSIQ